MKDPWSRWLGVLALGIALLSAGLFFFGNRNRLPGSLAEEIRLYLTVREMIREQYIEPVKEEQLLRNALRGMVASLDPYSRYYDPSERRELEDETAGKIVGIGIVIEPSQPALTVLFPQPGSPADTAGIRVGDRILAVDGISLEGMSFEAARAKVRGPEGSDLRLRVRPFDGSLERELTLQRSSLRDASIAHASMLDPANGIGYLWVSNFTEQTLAEFDQALATLRSQDLRALVIDLRFNPGGLLEAAVGLTNRFLCEGLIVSTEGRQRENSREHRAQASHCGLAGLPLAVLINADSASASEVFAGAIQDWKLGAIVGTRSYGKGVVQSLRSLGEEGLVKLTTSHYYTPLHRSFDRHVGEGREAGIKPELHVTISKAEEEAIRRGLNRFDVPETLRANVEEFRNKLGISEPQNKDTQREAAIAWLIARIGQEKPR